MAQLRSVIQEPPAPQGRLLLVPIFVGILLVVGAIVLGGGDLDIAAIVMLIMLTGLALFIFGRAAKSDRDGAVLFQTLVLAWLLKLGAMAFRLYIITNVYAGTSDALGYHQAGQTIAQLLAAGTLPEFHWGTEFVQIVTGFLYLFMGPSFIGAFVVFAWFGSMGMLLHYKAFVTALPESNYRWFRTFILFFPSMLFWTSSLGKDALVAFFLGMAAYGAARFLRKGIGIGSLSWLLVGIAGTTAVRPHIGAMVGVALAAAVLFRPIRAGALTPFIRIAMIAGAVALAVVVVQTAASFFDVEDLSVEGVTGFIESEQTQSEQGGSAFQATGIPTNPATFGLAVLTVLFRPFPWEAPNLFALASAMEGAALIVLLLYRSRAVLGALWEARRNAYLTLSFVYALMFVLVFSVISNFGILVRQRVQVLPFIFIWLAYQGFRTGQEAPTV